MGILLELVLIHGLIGRGRGTTMKAVSTTLLGVYYVTFHGNNMKSGEKILKKSETQLKRWRIMAEHLEIKRCKRYKFTRQSLVRISGWNCRFDLLTFYLLIVYNHEKRRDFEPIEVTCTQSRVLVKVTQRLGRVWSNWRGIAGIRRHEF